MHKPILTECFVIKKRISANNTIVKTGKIKNAKRKLKLTNVPVINDFMPKIITPMGRRLKKTKAIICDLANRFLFSVTELISDIKHPPLNVYYLRLQLQVITNSQACQHY